MSRTPSLAEQWFVEDGLSAMGGLCPLCADAFGAELRLFAPESRQAFSEIYRQSRAIRVQAAMDGRQYRNMDDWEALRVMRTIDALLSAAEANWATHPAQRNEE